MFADRILRTTRSAADVRQGRRDWFRFENKASDEADIYIFDEISWFGITAQDFARELTAVKASKLNLFLNSPGGDVFDGLAIHALLTAHPATVNVTVQGIAASIASVIAMAGDSVAMAKGSMMMIHEPFALVIGDAADMRKQAEALDIMGDSIAGIYAARAGKEMPDKPKKMPMMSDSAYWRGLMRDETWFGDQAAVDAGLADSVSGQAAVTNSFDLSIFRHVPGTTPKAATPKAEPAQPVIPDWHIAARRRVAAAQLEVIHGYGH